MTDAASGFGARALDYDALRPSYPPALYAFLLEHLEGPRAVCVDLGAGTGKSSAALAAHFGRVVAVERDARMLAAFAAPANVEKRNEAAEAVEFPPGSVDAVVIATAFHWMEQETVTARVAGWLRPDGVFFAFLYGPFRVTGAARAVHERHWRLWVPMLDRRIGERADYERPIAASGRFAPVRPFAQTLRRAYAPAEAAALFGTTSYASAYARSLADPQVYLAGLEAELAGAAEIIEVEFPLGGVLARKIR